MERDSEFQSIAEMPGWRNGTLLPITDPAQIDKLKGSNFTGCVIVAKDLLPKVPKHVGVIVSEQPLETLYEVLGSLRQHYVEQLTVEDEGKMTHDAMRAMLASFNDPNTRFIEPDQRKVLIDAEQGKFHGIGAIGPSSRPGERTSRSPRNPLARSV